MNPYLVFPFLHTINYNFFNIDLFEPYQQKDVSLISVRHGRAVSACENCLKWINIKGIGWQFGGPAILRPRKDRELIFGVMEEKGAKRELEVSEYIQKLGPSLCPKVLKYIRVADLCDEIYRNNPNLSDNDRKTLDTIVNLKYNTGETVNPSILYTQMKSPFRIADLAFFKDEDKSKILDFYCRYFLAKKSNFIERFAKRLGFNIGFLHENGIINDSLYYDNITLCAEICDYEWLTVPGMLLPNGQDASNIMTDERKEKEIIYAIEAVLRLAGMLQLECNFYNIFDAIMEGYLMHNIKFFLPSKQLQQIKNRENIIL